jgi:RNA polymerase sigma-70 factor (ECF subfamily)
VPDGSLDPFESQRPRLLGLAYRLLGGRADAEDVVQEAWLRWSAAGRDGIANPPGWLTTVTTRLALDRLRQVARRREAYVGPWLPDPISTEPTPEEHTELAESLTLGFLVVLDQLAPVERAVLLLADVFGEPYSVIAPAVGKTEGACRQIATRARRKVRDGRQAGAGGVGAGVGVLPLDALTTPAVEPATAELLGELMLALGAGDEARVVQLLDPDVVLVTDGGPNRHAARRPVLGAYRVGRLLSNLARRLGVVPARFAIFNASPALVLDAPDGPIVTWGESRGGLVTRLWVQLNPDKVTDLNRPLDLR